MKRKIDEVEGEENKDNELQSNNEMNVQISRPIKKQKQAARHSCPYLGTIRRQRLDFDFEKVCSVSLQTTNVYACLSCGKYFQGRSRGSHVYQHSVESDHHVFLNLHTKRFYCLPEDYEIIDSSLDDIKGMLDPSFNDAEIKALDTEPIVCRTLDGKQYYAGIVGLNNLGYNDYINVVLQALSHCSVLRDFFLVPENYEKYNSELLKRFGTLIRKMWSSKNFKNQVSPHDFLQETSIRSKKKFRIGAQDNPMTFISWLLNTLHHDMGGPKKSTIISECFQGRVKVNTEIQDEQKQNKDNKSSKSKDKKQVIVKESNFLFLSLDMPPPPLFRDDRDKTVIPQEPLFTLLSKFDGVSKHYNPSATEVKTYRITQLPKYLILHIQRFTNNQWFTEKNTTIVNFPTRALDMSQYLEKNPDNKPVFYNLMANIRHNGNPKQGTYNVHILQKNMDKWYGIEDLIVEEAMPQFITLSEAYIQVYERVDS